MLHLLCYLYHKLFQPFCSLSLSLLFFSCFFIAVSNSVSHSLSLSLSYLSISLVSFSVLSFLLRLSVLIINFPRGRLKIGSRLFNALPDQTYFYFTFFILISVTLLILLSLVILPLYCHFIILKLEMLKKMQTRESIFSFTCGPYWTQVCSHE